jgi:hypothetical protein
MLIGRLEEFTAKMMSYEASVEQKDMDYKNKVHVIETEV